MRQRKAVLLHDTHWKIRRDRRGAEDAKILRVNYISLRTLRLCVLRAFAKSIQDRPVQSFLTALALLFLFLDALVAARERVQAR